VICRAFERFIDGIFPPFRAVSDRLKKLKRNGRNEPAGAGSQEQAGKQKAGFQLRTGLVF